MGSASVSALGGLVGCWPGDGGGDDGVCRARGPSLSGALLSHLLRPSVGGVASLCGRVLPLALRAFSRNLAAFVIRTGGVAGDGVGCLVPTRVVLLSLPPGLALPTAVLLRFDDLDATDAAAAVVVVDARLHGRIGGASLVMEWGACCLPESCCCRCRRGLRQ